MAFQFAGRRNGGSAGVHARSLPRFRCGRINLWLVYPVTHFCVCLLSTLEAGVFGGLERLPEELQLRSQAIDDMLQRLGLIGRQVIGFLIL
jgi:hypothetical protein